LEFSVSELEISCLISSLILFFIDKFSLGIHGVGSFGFSDFKIMFDESFITKENQKFLSRDSVFTVLFGEDATKLTL
jgi:hypothetical protein